MVFSFVVAVFFCFKQKTAYEVRISDWSSDVCSSDLKGCCSPPEPTDAGSGNGKGQRAPCQYVRLRKARDDKCVECLIYPPHRSLTMKFGPRRILPQIGRATCRVGVCQSM